MLNSFNYSGENTLRGLVRMIKNAFVMKENGKGLSANDYTTDEKNKLAGLKNYELPTASSGTKGGVKIGAGLRMEGEVLSADIVWTDVDGRPSASADIGTDKEDKTKYATPYAVHRYVGTKLGAALLYKGSAAFASLPALTAENAGHVYNITDAFTTTSNFLEGAGHSYAAGQNVAVADAGGGVYRYDVLAQPVDLSGYLRTDALSGAVDDALVQAKESGAFDGESGVTPHIGANGNWFVGETDTGVKAQGEDGEPGYTPQKGVDYWVDADKNEMVNDVLAAMPTWEGGSY